MLCIGCLRPSSDHAEECKKYNQQAVDYQLQYSETRDTTLLIAAMENFEKAIQCNPGSIVNYQGKLSVLLTLERYQESLPVFDHVFKLSGDRDVYTLLGKALVLERMGLFDSSKKVLGIASSNLDEQFIKYPQDSSDLFCQGLYLTAVRYGKDSALTKSTRYMRMYPNDSTIQVFARHLRDFDRNALLPVK